MSYIITSYCSLYGPCDIFIVDTISCKIEDIPTIENIKKQLDQKEYIDNLEKKS